MADMIEMKTLTIDGKTYILVDETARNSIPKLLSELGDDPTHRTVTDEEKERWNSNNGSGGGGLTSADVVDNLLSDSATLPLSANQGRVLDEKISEQIEVSVDISVSSVASAVSGKCRYIPHLKMVVFECSFTVSGLEGGNGTTITLGNIPAPYRATHTVALVASANIQGADKMLMAMTAATGNIVVRTIGSVSSTTVHVAGCWFTE